MPTFILLPILSTLLLIFWCFQFLRLMKMQPDEFTSENDKFIWAAALIFLSALGALLFWIHFRPKPIDIPQLSSDIYDMAKQKFPQYTREIGLALEMTDYSRYDLEKWYTRKTPQTLQSHYKQGPTDVDPGCFGVLLAVLTAHPVNIEVACPNGIPPSENS